MQSRRNRIAAVLIMTGLLLGLPACTEKEPEEGKYVSPNFNTEVVNRTEEGVPAPKETTEEREVVDSPLSKGDPVNIADLENVPNTETTIAGSYENGSYYNPFVGFAIQGDTVWRLYDAAGVAEATGLSEDEVNDLWYGVVSPYSVKTMTCAIAYKQDTGSNLVVSYINPKLYYMQNMTAREYLELSARSYKDVEVQDVNYLGQTFSSISLPDEGEGARTQFAIRVDDLIVVLTYTLQGDDTLEDAADHVTKLITQ